MADIYFSDISEHQGDIDAEAYLADGNEIIICRTHNGYRPDNKMPSRLDYLRGIGFVGIGWYQYLVADRDPVSQAHEFIDTIGILQSNEFPVLDLEEGGGDQTGRADAWLRVVDEWCGFKAPLYSGEYYLSEHLGGDARWGNRPLWIANYPNTPQCTHLFHQFSSSYQFTGLGRVDGNVYRNGDAEEFMVEVRGGEFTPVSPQPILEEGDMITAVIKQNGAIEVFVEKDGGHVWHTWQNGANGKWYSTDGGKSVGWQSMGTPGSKD